MIPSLRIAHLGLLIIWPVDGFHDGSAILSACPTQVCRGLAVMMCGKSFSQYAQNVLYFTACLLAIIMPDGLRYVLIVILQLY